MSARLVAQLAQRGIHLRRVGDKLGVTAEPGILTPEASAFIQKHRDALLDALPPPAVPSFPSWPPAALAATVESRAAALTTPDLTAIKAEVQAADEALHLDSIEPHPTGRCSIHGCPQRKLPRQDLYRCPACVPGAFAGRNRLTRAA